MKPHRAVRRNRIAGTARLAVLVGVVGLAVQAPALTITVPNGFGGVEGNSNSNTLVRDLGEPRTSQAQIAVAQLSGIPVGAAITGLRWRMNDAEPSPFPPSDATWADYEITLAQAAGPIAGFTTDVAANMLSPVLVYDGPLTLTASSFPAGGSPNAFGPLIPFTTPYVYSGGDLVVLYSHTGSDIASTVQLDAADFTTPGYGSLFVAGFVSGFQAPTLNSTTAVFNMVQFEFGPSPQALNSALPEPSTLLLILGSLGLLAWRRMALVFPQCEHGEWSTGETPVASKGIETLADK